MSPLTYFVSESASSAGVDLQSNFQNRVTGLKTKFFSDVASREHLTFRLLIFTRCICGWRQCILVKRLEELRRWDCFHCIASNPPLFQVYSASALFSECLVNTYYFSSFWGGLLRLSAIFLILGAQRGRNSEPIVSQPNEPSLASSNLYSMLQLVSTNINIVKIICIRASTSSYLWHTQTDNVK